MDDNFHKVLGTPSLQLYGHRPCKVLALHSDFHILMYLLFYLLLWPSSFFFFSFKFICICSEVRVGLESVNSLENRTQDPIRIYTGVHSHNLMALPKMLLHCVYWPKAKSGHTKPFQNGKKRKKKKKNHKFPEMANSPCIMEWWKIKLH